MTSTKRPRWPRLRCCRRAAAADNPGAGLWSRRHQQGAAQRRSHRHRERHRRLWPGPAQRGGFSDFKPALADEIDAIVTNPPYRLAQQFVRHALTLCPRVLMLLRLTFLESERRKDVLDDAGLIRVHVFRNRLPMMHRDDWTGNRVSNPTAFAWYVWQRGYIGRPEIDRISWNRGAS